MKAFILTLALACIACDSSSAQDGWLLTSDGKTWAWYVSGRHLGWYDPARKVWIDTDGPFKGIEQPPPWMRCRQSKEAGIPNFGIVMDKIGDRGERYEHSGHEVTAYEARRLIGKGELKDDSDKRRLTVIGPEADRKRVVTDLNSHPALSEFKDKFLVDAFAPDAWQVAGLGFHTGGKPTIYLQQPDGRVLLRMDAYDGPEALAGGLRKADPSYDKGKDFDGKPKPLEQIPELPNEAWAAIVLAVAGVFAKYRSQA